MTMRRAFATSTAVELSYSSIYDFHESFSPAYRGEMSTKHIRSTADLVRFGASLKIECGSCGAARTRTGLEIARTCGAVSLGAVAARMRCSRCGEKAARVAILPPV